ncbi:hypothetical protein FRB91_000395 [Serendipita sp. 411]|nr:hypothetical protein FRB91_000395 [Serendipita sp. 411]
MLPSNRTSMDINDQSTVVSPNDSPKFKNSGGPSRVESMDLEAAAASASEKEKRPEEAITTTTSNVEDQDLERRRSAMREAWPDAELDADPTLAKEALQEEKDIFLVTFDRDDPLDPKNWGRVYRWYLTFASSLLVLNASFASSAPSGMLPVIMREFHMSQVEGTLTVSMFILGYVVGPFIWAPTSETVGRRPMFIIGIFGYFVFQFACALSPNAAALLIFRFLGGCFAACPLTNSGAILGDIWDPETRGTATAIFTLSPFAGPAIGPIVGGAIYLKGISWKWLFWILTIFAGLCWLLVIFTIPETYGPVILVKKAKALRRSTGDERYKAPLELQEARWTKTVGRILGRPWKIFFQEGMLVIITFYMSFVYGLLYLLFLAYPVVFVVGHHLNALESGLTFLPLFLGGVVAVVAYIFFFAPRYAKVSAAYNGRAPPEARLPMAKWGGIILGVSMLWFGWTSYPSISIWSPIVAGLGIGASVVLLFLSLFNYLIDAYLLVAASALASSTVVRSAFGAGFPVSFPPPLSPCFSFLLWSSFLF